MSPLQRNAADDPRAPVLPRPRRGTRQSHLGRLSWLARSAFAPKGSQERTGCVEQTPCNPHFQRPMPCRRVMTELRVTSKTRWIRVFTTRTRFGPRFPPAPLGILLRDDWVERVASDSSSPAAPRDALRNRREPRRATSLDRFYRCRVNGPSFHDPSCLPSPGNPKALRNLDRLFTGDAALDALSPAAAYAVLG